MDKKDSVKSDTEHRILQAAEEEFLQKGLEGARTTTIAERAGVTHAMLHYYFRTKGMLFERIISEKMQQVGNILLTVFVADDLPLMDRIQQGVEQHFDFIAAHPDLPRFVIQEIYTHPERHEMMRSQISGIVDRLLGDLQRQIDRSAAAGDMAWVDARMLFLDIISLNIFSFICFPIIKPLLGELTADEKGFLEKRKAENVAVIMKRLKRTEA
ncbi:MAG: TetR/AcrR family transcriptional regulator [Bacteroidaceae bacterium]|nr:TetR/AcrR family transcriptional regulator [Bacteroidaceae bacterium]